MTIGKQYADAMVLHPSTPWDEYLSTLEKIVKISCFQEQYNSPFVSEGTVFELICAVMDKQCSLQGNMTQLLIQNRRLDKITEIKDALKHATLQMNKQTLVQITTAVEPTPTLKKKIEHYASSFVRSGNQAVFEYHKETSLIGGFIVSIDGYIINRSVQSRLKAIAHTEGE